MLNQWPNIHFLRLINFGPIKFGVWINSAGLTNLDEWTAQPHTTLCIQLLDRENNNKNNTLPLGKQICLTIVWGCEEMSEC